MSLDLNDGKSRRFFVLSPSSRSQQLWFIRIIIFRPLHMASLQVKEEEKAVV